MSDELSRLRDEKLHFRAVLQVYTVLKGRRLLGRIEAVTDELFDRWKTISEDLGLETRVYGKETRFILLSKHERVLEMAEKLQTLNHPMKNRILGYLYRYPSCCVEHFSENIETIDSGGERDLKFQTLERDGPGIYPFYVNNFCLKGFILHNACSYSCPETVRIGKENLEIMRRLDPEKTARVREMNRMAFVSLEGREKPVLISKGFYLTDEGISVKRSAVSDSKEKVLNSYIDGASINIGFDQEGVGLYVFN